MTTVPPNLLSDAALLAETARAAVIERRSTSDLLALLAELDTRKLYLGQGYPSLFAYCTQALHLSEPSAYTRITAARAARRFPVIVTLLADGDVTLTTVTLLAAHLTDENHDALLAAARHKSKREVERLVASIDPQPDVTSSLRRAPAAPQAKTSVPHLVAALAQPQLAASEAQPESPPAPDLTVAQRLPPAMRASRAVVVPIAAERYLLKVTLSAEGAGDRREPATPLSGAQRARGGSVLWRRRSLASSRAGTEGADSVRTEFGSWRRVSARASCPLPLILKYMGRERRGQCRETIRDCCIRRR
jgi:hypothetical protein